MEFYKQYLEGKSSMRHGDVIACTLLEAREALSKAGIHIEEVLVASPPFSENSGYDESFRVIGIRPTDDKKVKLIVCKPL